MPSFIAQGCLEVGEKFPVGCRGLISIPTTELHQPEVGLVEVRLGCNNFNFVTPANDLLLCENLCFWNKLIMNTLLKSLFVTRSFLNSLIIYRRF